MTTPRGDDDWIETALAEGLFDSVDAPAPEHRSPLREAESGPVADATPHRSIDHADGVVVADDTSASRLAVFDESSGEVADDSTTDAVSDAQLLVAVDESISDAGETAASVKTRSMSDAVDDEPEALASFAKAVGEWIVVLVGAIAVALVLRATLFQAFFIPSESMEATLLEDDRVLVNKVSYRLHDINQGDVVVFRRDDDEPGEIRDLIKRVIGVPGQTVEGRDNAVWIDGFRLDEPYLADDEVILDFGPITVEEGQLFVMGDNRDESLDSRFFGPIDDEQVVGRAFVVFWPVNRLAWL